MNQMNFLPNWYIEKKAKNKTKKYIVLNFILFIAVLLILVNILMNKDKVSFYNDEIKKTKCQALKNKNKKNKNIIRKFNYIYFSKKDGIDINEIYMKKNEFIIEGKCKHISYYYKFIDCLENNNKFVMKSIVPPKNKEEGSSFKMILE